MLKPVKDDREYKYVKLKNGMRIIIVYDKSATVSAASMTIGVGSIDEEHSGIAHFLEHLLFMGNEKYPEDNIYGKTLGKYNGVSNAMTSETQTTYYYNVSSINFLEILDIFGNFFVSPLFNNTTVMSEMKAVDSEHSNNLLNDDWRVRQIMKTVSKKNHKFNIFGTGNMKTLNIPDIVEKVRDFYNKYYSSDNMNLAIVSNIEIAILEKYVAEIFNPIKHKSYNKLAVKQQRVYELPYDTPLLIYHVPIKSKEQIMLFWQMDYANELYDEYNKYGLHDFIGHLMGHEGYGSIYDTLRYNNRAYGLYAGMGDRKGNTCCFNIIIEATHTGFESKEIIIKTVYEYIKILREACYKNTEKIQELYNEYRIIKKNEMVNMEKTEGMQYAIYLSSKMEQSYYDDNIKSLIIDDYILSRYNSEINSLIYKILSYMTEDNCVVLYSSRDYDKMLNNYEEWYGTEYSIQHIYTQQKGLINPLYGSLYLPEKNKYLCDSNKAVILNIKKYDDTKPEMIKCKNGMEIWHQYCNKYNVDKMKLMVDIIMDKPQETISKYLTLALYSACINDTINPDLYECNMSNYTANISRKHHGLRVNIYGSPQKMEKVLDIIIKKMLYPEITKEIFIKQKTKIIYNLRNNLYDKPYMLSRNVMRQCIDTEFYSVVAKLQAIDCIEYEDIKNIIYDIKNKSKIRYYAIGNISRQDTYMLKSLFNDFNTVDIIQTCNPLNISDKNKHIVIKEKSYNSHEKNIAVSVYYPYGYVEIGKTDWNKKLCLINIINTFLADKFFDELRTKEQLGYIVSTHKYAVGDLKHYIMQSFMVQTNKQTSDYLTVRIKKFIHDRYSEIKSVSQNILEDIINSQINILLQPKHNLYEYALFMYDITFNKNKTYDYIETLIETYKSITRDDIIMFYDKYFIQAANTWTVQIN